MQVKTNLFEVEPKDFKIIRGGDTQNKFPVPSCEPIFRPREPKVPVQVSFRSLHEFSNRKSQYPHQGPVVQVSIEGRFFWFLLDTGAPITCVRRSIAYEMGWKTPPAHYQVKRDASQESKDEKYNFLNVDRIKIADAEFAGLIYDIDDYILERMSLRKIDGIFGCDKLTQKKVHFDFPKKKITFYPSNLDWENLKSNLKFDIVFVNLIDGSCSDQNRRLPKWQVSQPALFPTHSAEKHRHEGLHDESV
ncbi:retropepsin-like aspartic protease, partial [Armatimonas sp.]|uniref:retropepsin-like aspartic protease n=1 Tax=Armatimonas sp. TaxID=1872638 RepID=UPI002869F948